MGSLYSLHFKRLV